MGQLLTTTAHGQDVLAGSQVAQQLDFLQFHQQEISASEQGSKLLSWAMNETHFVAGLLEQ